MTENRTYRHEYKYLVSAAQIPVLQARVAHLMQPDPHAGADGQYRIRSLYYDDAQDRCLQDNEIGVDRKAKYRIRIYNGSDARIRLELKQGLRGKKHKASDPLSRALADQLIAGTYIRGLGSPSGLDAAAFQENATTFRENSDDFRGNSDNFWENDDDGSTAIGNYGDAAKAGQSGKRFQVLPGFCADMMVNRMHPAIIVEYDRTPFIYRYGNVRVTFDQNISSSRDFEHFFCEQIHRRPIMPAGMHLMEVKFDEFLPDVIYRALQLEQLRQTTFSKYYLCRIYAGWT